MKKIILSWMLFFSSLTPYQTIQAIDMENNSENQAIFSTFSNQRQIIGEGTYLLSKDVVSMRDSEQLDHIQLHLEPLKEVYDYGENIKVSGSLKKGDIPLQSEKIIISITYNEDEIYRTSLTTKVKGIFVHYIPLNLKVSSNEYNVYVSYGEHIESQQFKVKFKVDNDNRNVPPINPVKPNNEIEPKGFSPEPSSVFIWETKFDVPVSKSWRIQFDSKMDRTTINHNHIFIENNKGEKVNTTIDISNDSKEVIVTPISNLNQKERYTLWITNELRNRKSSLSKHIKLDFYTK